MKFKKIYLMLLSSFILTYGHTVYAETSLLENSKVMLVDAVEDNWLNREIASQTGVDIDLLTDSNYNAVSSITIDKAQINDSIPEDISKLTNLTSLKVTGSGLTGEIPSSIGGLTKLQTLDLSKNSLEGSIPTELGSLSKLYTLSLENNLLIGEIPESISNLENVRYLLLSYNKLTGEIPESFSNLSLIKQLGLAGNKLTGNIPDIWDNMSSLQKLHLNTNSLSGELPDSLYNATTLTDLRLYGNTSLTGELKSDIGNLNNLTKLYLDRCNFYGELPAELDTLTNLTILNLYENQFIGTVSDFVKNIDSSYAHLYGNFFDNIDNQRQLLFSSNAIKTVYVGDNINIKDSLLRNHLTTIYNGKYKALVDAYSIDMIEPEDQNIFANNLITNSGVVNLKAKLSNTHNDYAVTNNYYIINALDRDSRELPHKYKGANFNMTKRDSVEFIDSQMKKLKETGVDSVHISANLWIRSNGYTLEKDFSNEQIIAAIESARKYNITPLSIKIHIYENKSVVYTDKHELFKSYIGHLQDYAQLAAEQGLEYICIANENPTTDDYKDEWVAAINEIKELGLKTYVALAGFSDYKTCVFLDELDVIGLNLYPTVKNFNGVNTTSDDVFDGWQSSLKQLREAIGTRTQPFWITEFGITKFVQAYQSPGGQHNFDDSYEKDNSVQTNYYRGSYEALKNQNQIEGTFFWCVDSDTFTPLDNPEAISVMAEYSSQSRQQTNEVEDNWLNQEVAKQNNKELSDLTDSDYEQVTEIELADIDINSNIPKDITKLTNLTRLSIRSCGLTGEIPSSLGTLEKLTYLDLTGNKLTGSIPDELGSLSGLTNLYLENNKLTGEIPNSFSNLTKLKYLSLSFNQLTGTIPEYIGDFIYLKQLSLAGNKFSGEIPDVWSNLTSLTKLMLNANLFSGSIPNSLYDVTSLTDLRLYNNPNLTGEISSNIGKLTNLTKLQLDRCMFYGELPSELDNLTKLSTLSLYENQFVGVVSDKVLNLTSDKSHLYGNLFDNVDNQKQLLFGSNNSILANIGDNIDINTSLKPQLNLYYNNKYSKLSSYYNIEIVEQFGDILSDDNIILKNGTSDLKVKICDTNNTFAITNNYFTINSIDSDSRELAQIYKGANFDMTKNDSLEFIDSQMQKLQTAGIEYVNICANLWISRDGYTLNKDFSEEQTIQAIESARKYGITPLSIKTHIYSNNSVKYTDKYKLFKSYIGHVYDYAELAARYNLEYLCISNEQPTIDDYQSEWEDLIARVKGLGLKTYVALEGFSDYDKCVFLDSLDVVGLNLYPATKTYKGLDTTPQDVFDAWQSSLSRLRRLKESTDYKFWITEYGITNYLEAYKCPWQFSFAEDAEKDSSVQTTYYRGSLEALKNQPYIEGIFFWCVDKDKFSPLDNPDAINVLSEYKTKNGGIVDTIEEDWVVREVARQCGKDVANLTDEDFSSIVEISIDSDTVVTEIPDTIKLLKSLRRLIIRNNQLTGNIPDSLWDIDTLVSLDLYGNNLTGEIPDEVDNLVNLSMLTLSHNSLEGNIPESIYNCSELTKLYLDNNNFTGEISNNISNLRNLRTLHLQYNSLQGHIPQSITDLKKINTIYFNNNNLNGSIPERLFDMNSLSSIDLSFNQLTGTLPTEISHLANLNRLYISNNHFYGSLPIDLFDAPSLERVLLSANNFTGTMPEVYANNNITTLNVSDNQLIGNVATAFVSKYGANSFKDNLFENMPNQKILEFVY